MGKYVHVTYKPGPGEDQGITGFSDLKLSRLSESVLRCIERSYEVALSFLAAQKENLAVFF